MEFYETQQGRVFYEGTLPRLTKALEKIAESLSAPALCISNTQEVPKDFLTNFYWGNYDPCDGPDSEEVVQCSSKIEEAQKSIRAQVAPEVWAQIENIISLISQRNDIERAEAFAEGFRSATTMLAAGLSGPGRKAK